jgi:multicomponent Na+:H+ antiporter subunit E
MKCHFFRALFFLGVWLVISGFSPSGFAVGLAAAIAAAVVSARLLPCAGTRIRLRACGEMALRLPIQSAIAGFNVARRAFRPQLPMRPGFVVYTSRLPEGVSRSIFTVLVSMQPGSVPIAADRNGDFAVHCLDDKQPIGAALAADEVRVARVFDLERRHG